MFFIFEETNFMAEIKTQKKIASGPRKATIKKTKAKSKLPEVEHFIKMVDKYKLDFSYLKP